MVIGSLLLLTLFCVPLWQITLIAPQYPEAIGMNIWINKLTDMNPNDIKNINLLNHYIGMEAMPEMMKEFEYFPKIVLAMTFFGIFAGIIGRKSGYLAWFVAMSILGLLGMYDFWLWEHSYGHNLHEGAAIKFVDEFNQPLSYQPPLIGTREILNFTATSYPATGAYLLFCSMGLGLYAYFIDWKKDHNSLIKWKERYKQRRKKRAQTD